MRYYPLSKVKTGLITRGNEFSLDGKSYTGYYYVTYDGKAYPGLDPIQGGSKPLVFINSSGGVQSVPKEILNTQSKEKRKRSLTINLPNYGEFTPYIPQPTEEDYRRGHILRYFSKRINAVDDIIEISKEQHDDFLGDNINGFDTILFKVTSMFWRISGPLNDVQKTPFNRYPGIISTNERIVKEREKEIPGIIRYINNEYDKYAIASG